MSKHQLIVLRHGEAEHNIEQVFNANPSHPKYRPMHLTQKGRDQARVALEELEGFQIEAVYSSPLPRALETAEVMGFHEVIIDDRLTEIQMGDLEGSPYEKYIGEDQWDHSHWKVYGGESNADVIDRMSAFYRDLVNSRLDGHALVITHGTPSMELIRLITGEELRLKTGQFIQLRF